MAKELAGDFQNGVGKVLQAHVLSRAENEHREGRASYFFSLPLNSETLRAQLAREVVGRACVLEVQTTPRASRIVIVQTLHILASALWVELSLTFYSNKLLIEMSQYKLEPLLRT